MTIARTLKSHRLLRTTASSYQAKALAIPNCISALPLNDTSGTTAVDVVLGTNSTYNSCTLNNLAGPGASMGNAPKLVPASFSNIQYPSGALNSAFNKNAGTLALWVDLNEAWSASDQVIFIVIGADINNRALIWKNSANQLAYDYVAGGTTNGQSTISYSPSAGWHSLIMTWDKTANALKCFTDGVQIGTTQTISGSWTNALTNSFSQLGAQNGSFYAPCFLSFSAIYSRALSLSEVTSLATAQ